MLLELVEGFLAQHMLDAARIFSGGLSVHAESGEERGEHGVALVNAGGDLHAGFGQSQQTVLVDGNVTVIAQQANGTADARLGKAGVVRNVDRAHLSIFLRQNQDGFQVVFRAFLNFQCTDLLFLRYSFL